jgi:tRNA(adenine34) deaminase
VPEPVTDQDWMQLALACAKQASEANEVPIGAVIVHEGQLIAQAHNQPIATHDPTAHAEILALRQAATAQQNYRLPNMTLYVTLEPCPMCIAAMVHARIQRCVFGAYDPKTGACGSVISLHQAATMNHNVLIEGGICAEASASLLQHFFKQRR